jgi:hypothetical protein
MIDGKLHFLNNKTVIDIRTNDYYHIFSTVKRVVIVRTEKMAPYASEYVLIFYDYLGNELSRTEKITGEFDFWFADELKRVIAGQHILSYIASDSYIFDLDGNLIKKLIHDTEIKALGITFDNKYVWFVANKLRELKEGEIPMYPGMKATAYNHIMIFNTETGDLFGEYSIEGTQFKFENSGVDYDINFSQADFP